MIDPAKSLKTKARRTWGSGSVYERASDGKWLAVVSTRDSNGKRRRKVIYGKTETDVRAKLDREKDRGTLRHGKFDSRPLGDFAKAWVASFETSKYKATTKDCYTLDVEKYIIPRIGTTRLRDLTRVKIAAWLNGLRDDGVGPAVATARFD